MPTSSSLHTKITDIVYRAKKSRRHQTGCAAAATSDYRRQLFVSRRTTPLITHSNFAKNGECDSHLGHVDRLLDRSVGTAGRAVAFAFVAVKNNMNAVVRYVRLLPELNQSTVKAITGHLLLSNRSRFEMNYFATNGKKSHQGPGSAGLPTGVIVVSLSAGVAGSSELICPCPPGPSSVYCIWA